VNLREYVRECESAVGEFEETVGKARDALAVRLRDARTKFTGDDEPAMARADDPMRR